MGNLSSFLSKLHFLIHSSKSWKTFLLHLESRNAKRIIKHDFRKCFFECWFLLLAHTAQKLVLLKEQEIFLANAKVISELSKTFEKWINFPPSNVKVFKSIFSSLFFSYSLKTFSWQRIVLWNFSREKLSQHLLAPISLLFSSDSFTWNCFTGVRQNQSFEFIKFIQRRKTSEKPQFMEHITGKFKIL